MKDTIAIILAAGRGTRMRSGTPKVLHEILGMPVISYVTGSLKEAGIGNIIAVIGYGSDSVKKVLTTAKFVVQKKLLGSGDAVSCAMKEISKFEGDVVVICGDTPLIKPGTIKKLIDKHKASGASATLLTSKIKDPVGYGRIIRDDGKKILKIVEDLDASLYEEVIDEINVGTYCFNSADLAEALGAVKSNDRKKEIYLTDVIEILHNKNKRIESYTTDDPSEVIGINDRIDLGNATRIMKNRTAEDLMLSGVTIEDPGTTIIYPGVKVGPDTVIRPNTLIEGRVVIGKLCRIGPFTRIRPDVTLGDEVEIGNFVELVRTNIGDRSKVKHHTYLGDTSVGKDVNIGAGTITANYDGKSKHKTTIEDRAFIGVGSILIAPVSIGKGAIVGAGTVVPKNHNVPDGKTVVGVPARVLNAKTRGKR